MDSLAKALGHADRRGPLRSYCTGLLLPGERKSVEPMAARVAPENVRQTHQSLHHLVADAAWSDEAVMRQVRGYTLAAMRKKGPVICWVVDDTGFPKKGVHSVGVARQYCGQVGKQENCRVAVSLSVATWTSSLPIAWRLYLPEIWTSDPKRRQQAGIPEKIRFLTKPQIALEQIRQAVEDEVEPGVVVADAGYGIDGQFRKGVTELNLEYVVGVQSSMTVWEPGKEPLPAKPYSGTGRPPQLLRREQGHQPLSVKKLALLLPAEAWKTLTWRQGTKNRLRSAVCRGAYPPRTSGLLAGRSTSGRMAVDRVAQNRERTDEVLAFHSVAGNETEGSRRSRQAEVDHRAGLRGTETGTRPGSL
jgi:SRSO17 transposase